MLDRFKVSHIRKRIHDATNHQQLKEIGTTIYRDLKNDVEKRTSLLCELSMRRSVLDQKYIEENPCDVLKRILYRINTAVDVKDITKLGHMLFESEAVKTLNLIERDIMWRAYKHQKSKRILEALEKSEKKS